MILDHQSFIQNMRMFISGLFQYGASSYRNTITQLPILTQKTIEITTLPMFRHRIIPTDCKTFQHNRTKTGSSP